MDVQHEGVECHQVQELLRPCHLLERLLHLRLCHHSAHSLFLSKLLEILHGDAGFVLDGSNVKEELA